MKTLRLLALAGLALCACAVAGPLLAESAVKPPRRPILPGDASAAQDLARAHGADLEVVHSAASDAAVLEGWLFKPRRPVEKALLFLHGVSDCRVGTLPYLPIFLGRGYAVLCPDTRAHGGSGGSRAFYGALEAREVSGWVDLLLARTGAKRVFGFGESMGAGILLQSLQQEARFAAVAAESPFASFEEVSFDYIGRPFGAGPWLGRTLLRGLVVAGRLHVRLRYGVNLGRASAEDAVAATRVPILLIHGLADENIPVRHSRRLKERNPALVELWEVPGATHCGALGVAREEFEKRVIGWFERPR
ncbi:MAG: alpha/beta fold hydrolase [Planctomycetes bacterium]|nr:alpha/beta fold hydrolase [Planctomycetota bacterium]